MNRRKILMAFLTMLLFTSAQCGEVMFQASTIDALMQGVYDGTMTFGELKKHGDFGLGTVNALDGEMIALDGKFYQGLADGKILPLKNGAKTPFASMTFFQADAAWTARGTQSFAQLQKSIDERLPSENLFYAIRITGTFSVVKLRSVPRQSRPYRPLDQVVKTQSEFELHSIQGTLVGFRCPPFVKGVNVPGYHFHFISSDGTKGGHVLGCSIRNAAIQMDTLSTFEMVLPKNRSFLKTDLSEHRAEALRVVEQGAR
ncbi:MAG: acetolactate decarboxylase [Chthoniobacterales bacterium]